MIANLTPLLGGHYNLTFHSADFIIQKDTYRLTIRLYLANRTAGSSELFIKIILIPTELTITADGMQVVRINMTYGDTRVLTVVYYDNWPLHSQPGISGGVVEARVGSSVLVISTTELGNGTYQLTIFADPGWIPVFLQENTISVLIELSALNCANITKTITVVVVPTDLQKALTTAVNYGFPIFFVKIVGICHKCRKLISSHVKFFTNHVSFLI